MTTATSSAPIACRGYEEPPTRMMLATTVLRKLAKGMVSPIVAEEIKVIRAKNLEIFKKWIGGWTLKRKNEVGEDERKAILAPKE